MRRSPADPHGPLPIARRRVSGVWLLLMAASAIGAALPLAASISDPSEAAIAAPGQIGEFGLSGLVLASLGRAAWGLCLGAFAGMVLGLWVACSGWTGRWPGAVLDAVCRLPAPVLLPLALLAAWPVEATWTAAIAASAFAPMAWQARRAVQGVRPALLELAVLQGLTRWGRLRHVILPAVAPSLVHGLGAAAGASWCMVIVVEALGGAPGIGQLVWHSGQLSSPAQAVLGVFLYAAAALLIGSAWNLGLRRAAGSAG